MKSDPDLKKEEDAGPVNDAIVSGFNEQVATRLNDAKFINSKAGVATRLDVTDDSVSISSQTDDILTSGSPLDDLNSSSIPALETAIKLLAPVLGQGRPLQEILRDLEYDLQPQVQQGFSDAMMVFEAFYTSHYVITAATIRDSGKEANHLEAGIENLEIEPREVEEDASKARRNCEANVN
ncbi:MAG: hypothetical protein Q9171_004635 [Xanthocarpia ochracea]